jgi:hypothetical protein
VHRLLHAITAAFHEVRDRYKEHRKQDMVEQQQVQQPPHQRY